MTVKNVKVLYFIALVFLVISCKKDEPNPDYASIIAGTYTGTVTYGGIGSVAGTSKLSKSTESVVDLIITIGTSTVPLNGITVSSSSSNVYNLSFVDSSGSFTGKVQGKKLDWTLTSGADVVVFTGIK